MAHKIAESFDIIFFKRIQTTVTMEIRAILADSLKQAYIGLNFPQEDIDCLTTDHKIYNSEDLVTKEQSLERMELDGVSEWVQKTLVNVLRYIEYQRASNVLTDPLANFTTEDYYEYIETLDYDFFYGGLFLE